MKLNTLKFGEIEVDEALVFDFIEQILGYEHLSRYVLIDYNPQSPFKWLQSIEDTNISFPVTIPALFGIDYTFTVPEELAKELELQDIADILTLNIVNIPKGHPELSTVNLLSPIVININNKKAIQMILQDAEYSLRQRLFKDGAEDIQI
ncbi:MAG: flagellar assembly protein FliW [Candidatus Gastranaerophilales bacterium]|nr:flagellar assembly protein FliW [Candidatus Gastranaerophilales bacterium]